MKMTIVSVYYQWLIDLVCAGDYYRYRGYSELLKHLHSRDFTWIEPMDENRAYDGLYLRDLFVDSAMNFGSTDEVYDFEDYFGNRPCSILEMIAGLAYRCEDAIMHDDDYGDRTGYWFWVMVKNLGLLSFTDARYNEHHVDAVLDIFLNRTYESNGIGGLFVVKDNSCDMRTIEIWKQMQMYLTDILNNEGE